MDAFLVKRVVSELAVSLRGAVVSKIHQPQEREILLTLWTGREEKRLLLSAHPEQLSDGQTIHNAFFDRGHKA